MYRNHIKMAWRNLIANKTFSIINVLGLSLGLAITILLFLFITYERTFDTMYAKKDNIYRVLLHTDMGDGPEIWCGNPSKIAPSMMGEISNVKNAARIFKHNFGETAFVSINKNTFQEKKFFWGDNSLIDIFDMKLLKSSSKTPLERPRTVIISKSTATKYFSDIDPIGKTILIDSRVELEVTGVFEDFPSNSTLDSDVIASFSSTNHFRNPSWSNASFETFFLLDRNDNTSATVAQMQQVLNKNVEKKDQWYSFSLQPLPKVHLYSAGFYSSDFSRVGDINEIRNLSMLGILILLLACINYMNLTTAKSQKRTKDIGITKTLGANTKNVIARFYIETGLITFIAIFIGILLAFASIPLFNELTGNSLDRELIINFPFLLGILLIWFVTTLIAGSYPAIYLSRFSPRAILQPSFKQGKIIVYVRKGLVIMQFVASIILITGVIIVYEQIQFIKNQKLGYNPENVVAISAASVRGQQNRNALLQEFKSLSSVKHAVMAQGFPGMNVSGRSLFLSPDAENGLDIQTNRADAGTIKTLQLKLLTGSDLPENKQVGDTIVDVVLNKKAIDYLGYSPEEAIGKRVDMYLGGSAYIRGVVDNFNFESLHVPIGAYAFHNGKTEPRRNLLVRFRSEEMESSLNLFKKTFKRVIPNSSFEYTFLDKNLERLYAEEQKTANIGSFFCILAIFVACLGLFGLATFMVEQRKKEIGIRKVLGQSITQLTILLSNEFTKLVFISIVIAMPIAYLLAGDWLSDFAYRIELNMSYFLLVAIFVLIMALAIVSSQTIRAAGKNPIDSLRKE